MKKHKIRGKLVFSTLLVLSFFAFNDNIYAKNNDNLTDISPQQSYCDNVADAKVKENCKKAVNLCKDKLITEIEKYGVSASVSTDDILTYSIATDKITDITVGKKITVVDDNNQPIASGTKLVNKFNMITFSSNVKTTQSYSGDNGKPIECTGTYKKFYYFNDTSPVGGTSFNNPDCSTKGICRQYIDGKTISGDDFKGLNGTYSYKKLKEFGNVDGYGTFDNYLKQKFKYCDCDGAGKTVSVTYGKNYVKKQILNIAKSFYYAALTKKKISEYGESQIKFSTDNMVNNTKINFTCDAFGPSTAVDSRFSPIKNSEGKTVGYNNVRKFAKLGAEVPSMFKDKDGKDVEACSVQCGEEVEVSYGPPVAVRGTVCFEYIITVKSKIMCSAKVKKENMPTPPTETPEQKVCNMKVYCNSDGGIINIQAGPNEKFDECVKTKFNGKYTQQAINYCYNKVYKNNTVKKVNNYMDDIVAKKVDNSCPWWNNEKDLSKISYTDTAKLDEIAKNIKDAALKKSSGKYVVDNYKFGNYQGYKWSTNSTCYWDKYMDIYKYDDVTVKSLVYDDVIFAGNNYPTNNYQKRADFYAGYVGNRVFLASISTYSADARGAKRAKYTNTGGSCEETCYVYTTDTNCVVPGSTITPNSNNTEWEKYEKALERYYNAISTCKSDAQCKQKNGKTKTTYVMTAGGKTKESKVVCKKGDKKTKNCTEWYEEKEKEKQPIVSEKQPNGHIILKDADGKCYLNYNNQYHYYNKISFPGYWLDYGKNAIYVNPSETEQKFLKFMPNQYCVDPRTGNVNVDWWKWDQEYKRDNSRKNEVKHSDNQKDGANGIYTKYEGEYNIYGEIKDFGHFDWNLIFDCFYAVYQEDPTIDRKAAIENVYTKPIALDQVFPDTDNTTKQSSTKNADEIIPKKLNVKNTDNTGNVVKVENDTETREIGYNWTCDASNLLIKSKTPGVSDYTIAPTLLRAHIEQKGDSIYEANNAESKKPDYKITLTPDNIRSIKKAYNGKSYFDFSEIKKTNMKKYQFGDKEVTIDFYESDLLRNTNYVSSFSGKATKNNRFCNNIDESGNGCYDIYNDASLDANLKYECNNIEKGGN